jgi:hypothetical protein
MRCAVLVAGASALISGAHQSARTSVAVNTTSAAAMMKMSMVRVSLFIGVGSASDALSAYSS